MSRRDDFLTSPAFQLLLACAASCESQEHDERIRKLCALQQDWPAVLRLAAEHGMRPLLYSALCRSAADVPLPVREELRRQHEFTTLKNLRMTAELLHVLRRLSESGITALPYKGPALAAAAYGGLALREFCDLDVLVAPTDTLRALDLLEADGYVQTPEIPLAHRRHYLRNHCEFSLEHPDRRITVELHWRYGPAHFGFEPDFRDLAARTSTVNLGGAPAPVLSTEDHLLALAIHGSKHFWSRLCWTADFAALLRCGVDFATLLAHVRAAQAERVLLVAFAIREQLLGEEPPLEIAPLLRSDAAAASLAREIAASLALPAYSESWRLRRFWFFLRLHRGWWERARFAVRYACTPGYVEWRDLPLARPLFFLYPLVRLARLVAKLASALSHGRSKQPAAPSGAAESSSARCS